MDKENSQDFQLGSEDCALILKKDMTTEIVIPKFNDDRSINWEENQNMFVIIAIAASMDNPEFSAVITKKLDEIMMQAKTEPSGCCPGGESREASDCGGCPGTCNEDPQDGPADED